MSEQDDREAYNEQMRQEAHAYEEPEAVPAVPASPPSPNVTIDEYGDHVCEHGTAMDVHCCACRRRGFFPPDNCDCYGGA